MFFDQITLRVHAYKCISCLDAADRIKLQYRENENESLIPPLPMLLFPFHISRMLLPLHLHFIREHLIALFSLLKLSTFVALRPGSKTLRTFAPCEISYGHVVVGQFADAVVEGEDGGAGFGVAAGRERSVEVILGHIIQILRRHDRRLRRIIRTPPLPIRMINTVRGTTPPVRRVKETVLLENIYIHFIII